jgi:hypothetical protein
VYRMSRISKRQPTSTGIFRAPFNHCKRQNLLECSKGCAAYTCASMNEPDRAVYNAAQAHGYRFFDHNSFTPSSPGP